MGIIPESGKPADLDFELIKNQDDCALVVSWLDTVVADIDRQLEDRENADQEWVRKCHAAIRATNKSKFRILEMQREMNLERCPMCGR